MKKLLRPRREIWGSLDGFLDPRRIHGSKTGRASGRTGRKSLIINGQILHRPPRSSGYPEPIRGNPNLRAETCPSGRTPAKSRTATPVVAASATPMQHPQIVAPCCSVLQRVAPCFAQKFSHVRCNTAPLARAAGPPVRCRPLPLTRLRGASPKYPTGLLMMAMA